MPSEEAQNIADIFDAVSGRVPNLLRSVLGELYSPEAGRRMGQAIGAFYQELTAAGLPPERAIQLAEDYASPFSLVRSMMGEGQGMVSVSHSESGEQPRRSRGGPSAPMGPAPLEALFNSRGTSDDAAPAAGDLDGVGWSLSAQALQAAGVLPGGPLTVEGITFHWPQARPGTPDNVACAGQEVVLPAQAGARRLGILGLATHGPAVGLASLRYADGHTQAIPLAFPDWTLNGGNEQPPQGTEVAIRMPRRNGRDGESTDIETVVFAMTVPLRPEVAPERLTLPARTDQGGLHVFAIALGA